MRTGLIVDAGCDLPQATLDQYKIRVAPIQIRVKDRLWTDDRNPATTAEFYATVFAPGGGASDAESFATTVDEFNALLLAAATTTDDYTFIQCISRSRSPIYTNANEACGQALRTVQRARFAAGVKGPFAARALNSQTLFAGQGALAITSAQLMADAKSPATADRLEALAASTYAYAVPRDLKYLYERGAKRGDKSVGLMAVTVGGMLDVKPVLMGHGNETKPVNFVFKAKAY